MQNAILALRTILYRVTGWTWHTTALDAQEYGRVVRATLDAIDPEMLGEEDIAADELEIRLAEMRLAHNNHKPGASVESTTHAVKRVRQRYRLQLRAGAQGADLACKRSERRRSRERDRSRLHRAAPARDCVGRRAHHSDARHAGARSRPCARSAAVRLRRRCRAARRT